MITGPWVPSLSFLASVMNDIVGYDASSGMSGVLRSVYLGLGISPTPAPSPNLLMGGITEANYDGYARQPVVWFPTYLDLLGPQSIQGANMQFRPTDATVPNTITFVFLASATSGGLLLLSQLLPTPVQLTDATRAVQISPVFQLSFLSNYGACYANA